jgi:hypothetical protein
MKIFYSEQEKGRFAKAKDILKNQGFESLIIHFFKFIKYRMQLLFSPLIIAIRPKRHFIFQNNKLCYFFHKYNVTWTNERSIEIPIILEYLKKSNYKRILEVGAVLNHYFSLNHDILDKFEKGKNIINEDIVDFVPLKKYDFIISISTLEHIGFDEDKKDPNKIIKAVQNIRNNCLSKGGIFLATMPIGYNKWMDKILEQNKLAFTKKYFMKRIKKNAWIQVESINDIKSVKYGTPHNGANAIIVALLQK